MAHIFGLQNNHEMQLAETMEFYSKKSPPLNYVQADSLTHTL